MYNDAGKNIAFGSEAVKDQSSGLTNPKFRPRSAHPRLAAKDMKKRPQTASVSGNTKEARLIPTEMSSRTLSDINALQIDESAINRFPQRKPVNRTKPMGASSSGHYTMKRQHKSMEVAKNVSVAEMLKSIYIPKPAARDNLDSSFSLSQTESEKPVCINRRGTKFRLLDDDCFPEPDFKLIDEHVAKLSDIDALPKKLIDSLIALYEITQSKTDPDISQVYFEKELLDRLVDLLPTSQGVPEVQIYSSLIINYIILNYPTANEVFLRSGKLPLLLKATEIAAKLAISKFTVKSGHHRNYYISSQELSANSKPNLLSSASKQSLSKMSDEIQKDLSPKSQSATCQHVPLKSSVLSKYYQDSFWDSFQCQGSENRKKSVSEILSVCQKIDLCAAAISSAFINRNSERDSLEELLIQATEIMAADEVLLYKYDESKQSLQALYYTDSQLHPASLGIVGEAFRTKMLLNIENPEKDPRFKREIDFPIDGYPISLLCLPTLNSEGQSVGVLLAINKQTDYCALDLTEFNTLDEYLLRMLATACGFLLDIETVQGSIHTTKKRVSVLLETAKCLGSISDSTKLTKMIMDSAVELLSSDRCALFLYDGDRNQLIASIQHRNSIEEIRIPSNAGIAGAVFTSGNSVNISNAYEDSRFNQEIDKKTGYVTKTILCTPIKNVAGDSIGVMQMINKKDGVFSTEDEMILNSFASQAAVAIEKSRLFKNTEDMRIYLQSILQSITSCVITLADNMKMSTMNRPWLADALGVDQKFMKENPVDKWLGSKNFEFLKDINHVFKSREAIYASDYEVKGKVSNLIINYQVMPLIGGNGLVMVLDDISAEKRAVMTLGRYMSPALAKQVMKEGEDQLGGKRKKVSILFSDIRSFTTLSENMDPKEIVELLNHHFTDAVNAITEEQGILDKFIGDAVMAVFGVPFSSSSDSTHACNAALRMRDALLLTNKAREARRKPAIKIGIGINTGVVLSGNIGSVKRMEFSCIGDAVNVASRTESLTKFYGIQIMVTDQTLRETGDSFITREIEPVIVSGKKKIVKVYELLGRKGDVLTDELHETVGNYAVGLELYKKRLFHEASAYFGKHLTDGPSKVLYDRCLKYSANPPDELWNGAYLAEGK